MSRHRVIRPVLSRAILTALLSPLLAAGPPATPAYPDHTRLLVVRDSKGEETPITTAADWQVRRAHILAHLQEVMGPLPGGERRVPLAVEVVETIDGPAYVRKKITYAAEPGDRVPAWILLPKGRKGKAAAVLCLHQTTRIGKDEPVGLGGKPDLRYARELAERGYVTIAPDYPNYGEYRVDPYGLGYASASMKGIWNHMRAVDVLTTLPEVDPERIGVIGHSLGGHNAIFVALFDERIKAVISSCGFNAFPNYYGGKIAGWSHQGYMPRLRSKYGLDLAAVPFDFPELIGALAPRPVFVNAPARDANFAIEGVKACLDAATPVYRLLGHPERLRAIHPDAEHTFPSEAREAAYRFVDDALKP
jgi:dienelactone hydrolase